MIDNQEEQIVEIQEAVVEIILPQQAQPAKTLKQKDTEAILAKIAPMLAILKKEDLSNKRKMQQINNLLRKNETEDVTKLAYELDAFINNPQELLAVVEHIYEGNDALIGDYSDSFIGSMKDFFSQKAPLLAIALALIMILPLLVTIFMVGVSHDWNWDKILKIMGFLSIVLFMIVALAVATMLLAMCTPRSLYEKIFSKEQVAVQAAVNQVLAPAAAAAADADAANDRALDIEGMNALLTIMNEHIKSVSVPTKSARMNQENENTKMNSGKVSGNMYSTFSSVATPPAGKKVEEVDIYIGSDTPVLKFA